jgi:hypothetical protein
MTDIEEIYQEFVTEMKATIVEYRAKLKTAPMKRGWNRTFGTSISNKSDVLRERDAYLKQLNADCELLTQKSLVTFAEDKEYVSNINIAE